MASDLDQLCDLLWRPDIQQSLYEGGALPRDAIKRSIERAAQLDPGPTGLWIIETKSDGCAGYCGIENFAAPSKVHSPVGKGVALQIALHPGARGKGYATQAVEALVHHVLSDCGLERILAFVFELNERSHRLMLRCQFSEIGRIRSSKVIVYERRHNTRHSV